MQTIQVIGEFVLGMLQTAAVIFVVLFVYMFVKERRKENKLPAWELALGLAALLLQIVYSIVAALILPVAVLVVGLLAVRFLYPGALGFSTLAQILPLLISAWLTVWLLRRFFGNYLRLGLSKLGLSEPWKGVAAALAEGLAIGLALAGFARFASIFEPSIELPVWIAVTVGLLCGFTSYYVRLYRNERGVAEKEAS